MEDETLERILRFLLRNWAILVLFPIVGLAVGYILTLSSPTRWTARITIAEPPYPIEAFSDLRQQASPQTVDGSIDVRASGATEGESRTIAESVLASARNAAESATAESDARREVLARLEDRLSSQVLNDGNVADLATAIAALGHATDAADLQASTLARWRYDLLSQEVVVTSTNGANRTVPFAAFSGFTLALLIAIGRHLWMRRRDAARGAN